MQGIEHHVQSCPYYFKAQPHHGKDWVTREWRTSLRVFGRLRDNETNLATGKSFRADMTKLLTALPDELVKYAPEVAAPGATEDVIYKGLWNLLSKHQGEARSTRYVCCCLMAVCVAHMTDR